ncbi:Pantetheinase [Exaiptasia diaphana]|nr:Pantetheinase [Exaiptasia diaphana]
MEGLKVIVMLWVCMGGISTSAHDSSLEFVAAVYEHAVIGAADRKTVLTKQQALKIVMTNMDIYELQIQRAKEHNTSIIVFPEYGLTGFGYTRDSFKPFLEDIPDPMKTNLTACNDPTTNLTTPIIYRLSCLARDNSIYIVANMGDIKVCHKDPHCPKDGRYQYNTNVVFNDMGTLVARYHKQHPFLNEMKVVDRPRVPEFITFITPFGKFGTMICFDVLFHDPAIPLVTEYNVDHIVFPTGKTA